MTQINRREGEPLIQVPEEGGVHPEIIALVEHIDAIGGWAMDPEVAKRLLINPQVLSQKVHRFIQGASYAQITSDERVKLPRDRVSTHNWMTPSSVRRNLFWGLAKLYWDVALPEFRNKVDRPPHLFLPKTNNSTRRTS